MSWYLWLRVDVLQDLAVEAAFPQCGISRVHDNRVKANEQMISDLQDGTAYYGGEYRERLLAGSRPEGLAMEDDWGHVKTDNDYMYLKGGQAGVNVGGRHPRGQACLDLRPEGCPAAYTKLQITDLPQERGLTWMTESVHRSGNQCWLDTNQAVHKMGIPGDIICGPAAQRADGTRDSVQTLVCNGPHPDMCQEFPNRPRQWPPASLITVLLKLPILLVLVGHKLSPEFNLQARISWSHLELKLIQGIPESVRHGYIACKYVLKRLLKARRGQNEVDGSRSSVSSYHVKTVFLRYLEKNPPSMITSPFRLFLDLLHELDGSIKMGELPHYFLAQCNLLETVGQRERDIARQVIEEILLDPLNALLTSPTDPQQIYGEVRPELLVLAFHKISSYPACKQSLRDLSELLICVDERRRQRYIEQCERDSRKVWRVSGRSELTELTGMLQQIKLN